MWSFFTKVYKRISKKVTLTKRNMNSAKSSGMRNATGIMPQQDDTSASEERSHEDIKYATVRRKWTDRHNGSGETASQPLEDLGGANLNLQRWYHEPNDRQPYNAVGAVRMPANWVADDRSGPCESVQTSQVSRRVQLSETDKEAKG